MVDDFFSLLIRGNSVALTILSRCFCDPPWVFGNVPFKRFSLVFWVRGGMPPLISQPGCNRKLFLISNLLPGCLIYSWNMPVVPILMTNINDWSQSNPAMIRSFEIFHGKIK